MDYQKFISQPLLIVSNGINKGIILPYKTGTDHHEIINKAHVEFYGPYSSFAVKDLNTTQVYEPARHSFAGRLFGKIQFHAMGGVTTTYDSTIDTHPTTDQCEFLNNRQLECIVFFSGTFPINTAKLKHKAKN